MKIIKDNQIIEDKYSHITDETKLTAGDISVSLSRWKNDKKQLSKYRGNIGVRLFPSDKIEDIAEGLDNIKLIALEFPAFTDGRSFSQARLLRSQYHFNGEIRAIGHYIPDQVFYLSRVGVNAFQLESQEQLDLALSTLKDFTITYQASTD